MLRQFFATYNSHSKDKESMMKMGQAFVSNGESFEFVKPCDGALDYPSDRPKSILKASASNQRSDTFLSASISNGFGVVSLVRAYGIRPFTWMADLPFNPWDGFQERQRHLGIMDVSRCRNRDQRQPISIRKDMMLRPRLASIDRIWTCGLSAALCPNAAGVNHDTLPFDIDTGLKFCQNGFVDALHKASFHPFFESTPAGVSAFRQVFPHANAVRVVVDLGA